MTSASQQPPYFGKYQKVASIAYFLILYSVFYLWPIPLLYALYTHNYYIIISYILVVILQRKVKRNQTYINLLNNIIQVRKGLKEVDLRYEEPINQKDKCLFGFHPHGVLSTNILTFMNYHQGPLSNMVTLSSRAMLNLPFVGLVLRLWGVESVNHKNMKRLMKHNQNVALVPGGFQQATITVNDELRLFIKERKGFIKYALQHNYTIYPVLSLTEHKLFWTFRYFLNFRLWLNKFKIPAVLFFNPKYLGFPRLDIPFKAIVGKGIRGRTYNQGQTPSNSEINQAHASYIQEIKRIYESHKQQIGDPLVIY